MCNRRGQFDMAHALAAHFGKGDFDAALLADDAAILHALVLAAQALVVLDRPKDTGAEQTIPLRLEGAVVDGFRFLDLAVRPRANTLRAGDGNPDVIEGLRARRLVQDVDQLAHALLHIAGPQSCAAAILLLRVTGFRKLTRSSAPTRR